MSVGESAIPWLLGVMRINRINSDGYPAYHLSFNKIKEKAKGAWGRAKGYVSSLAQQVKKHVTDYMRRGVRYIGRLAERYKDYFAETIGRTYQKLWEIGVRKAFPKIRAIRVAEKEELGKHVLGAYDPKTKEIILNKRIFNNAKVLEYTQTHEALHASGASERADTIYEAIYPALLEAFKRYARAQSNWFARAYYTALAPFFADYYAQHLAHVGEEGITALMTRLVTGMDLGDYPGPKEFISSICRYLAKHFGYKNETDALVHLFENRIPVYQIREAFLNAA